MALSKIKSSSIDDGTILDVDVNASAAIGATKLAGTLDLSSKTVTLPEASVTAHVTSTDLTPVRQDINALALYNAVTDNRAAYNLPYSFIDHFQDDTGITTETTVDRDSSGEYVDTKTTGSVVNTWTIEGFFNMYSV